MIFFMILIVFCFCLAGVLFCIFMGFRNEAVFRARTKALDYIFDMPNDSSADDKLLTIYHSRSYAEQMWQFKNWKMTDFFPEFRTNDHIQPTKPWPKK